MPIWRRTIGLVLMAGLLAAVEPAAAVTYVNVSWTDADPCSHDWESPSNWNTQSVPMGQWDASVREQVFVDWPVGPGPLIDEGTAAVAALLFGPGHNNASCDLTVAGGSLAVSQNWSIAQAGQATATISGGQVDVAGTLSVGIAAAGQGLLQMSGGALTCGELQVGSAGLGRLELTGGTIDVAGDLEAPAGTAGTATARVHLQGGTLTVGGQLQLRDAANRVKIDLDGGMLVLAGDQRLTLQGYLDQGWVAAHGGDLRAEVQVEYDAAADRTMAVAVWPDDPGVWANVDDYATMWWAYGLRDSRKVFHIQTSRFGLAFDYDDFDLTRLGPIATPPPETDLLTQTNATIDALPAAGLTCAVEVGTNRYEVVSAGPGTQDCMLIESGKYFQRRWLEGLVLAGGAPAGTAYLELSAWPDRLALAFYFEPDVALNDAAIELSVQLDPAYNAYLAQGAVQALVDAGGGGGFVALADDAEALLLCDPATSTCTVRLLQCACAAGTEYSVGLVLYPAAQDAAGKLAEVVAAEIGPLTVEATQTVPEEHVLVTSYDARRGWHHIGLRNDRTDLHNDRIERVPFSIENPTDAPRTVRLNFGKEDWVFGVTGVTALICDRDEMPVGLPVQLSKNWHRDPERPHRFEGTWFHGLTMLTVPARTRYDLVYTSVGGHWGGVGAVTHSQLSLVGWNFNAGNQLWDTANQGNWGECNTFDIDVCLQRSMIDDTLPLMVWNKDSDTPQKWRHTNNVGGGDFLCLWDGAGQKQWNSRMRPRYRTTCPCLTDVSYAGRTQDNRIDVQCRMRRWRTDDVNRSMYDIRYDVLQAVDVDSTPSGNQRRIALFQLGADNYNNHSFEKMAYGNVDGLIEEWSPVKGGLTYSRTGMACPGRLPWFSLHEGNSKDTSLYGAWANRGLVIHAYRARLGGVDYDVPYAAVYGTVNGGIASANVELSIPDDVTQLLPGDYVEAKLMHLVLPQFAADYYGPNVNLAAALTQYENTWRLVHRDAVMNDLDVTVHRGVLEETYPLRIRAQGGVEFTVTGGLAYVPMTFAGLCGYRGFTLQEQVGGDWVDIDQAVHGNDFWQSFFDVETGSWELTFTVSLDNPAAVRLPRRFRLAGPGLACSGHSGYDDLALLVGQWLAQGWQETGLLLGWWRFDESGGTTAQDSSGRGNHATVTTDQNWIGGRLGNALAFDGATWVEVPAADLDLIDGQVSIALWQYGDVAAQPDNADVVFHGNSPGVNRTVLAHLPWSTGTIYWDAGDETGYDRISKPADPCDYEGQWNHWVFTKDAAAGVMRIYRNGQLWQEGTGKTRPLQGMTGFTIGAHVGGSGAQYIGWIDEFRLYNYVLTPGEVAALYGGADVGDRVECTAPPADVNGDCLVNLLDFGQLAGGWLQ